MASSPSGQTPLISACSAGQEKVARYLVSMGASVNAARTNGVTALYVSAYGGYPALVTFLLQQGAEANRAAYGGDETPLHVAVRKAHVEVVQALKLGSVNLNVNAVTRDGSTPLHFAARQGDATVLVDLLACPDINVNAICDDGSTPLHIAACTGTLAMVEALLQAGADGNQPRTTDQLTPVACAVSCGWTDLTRYLAVKGNATTANLDRSSRYCRRMDTSDCMLELLQVRL